MKIAKKPDADLLESFRCFPSDRLHKGIGVELFALVDHHANIAEFQIGAEQVCNMGALIVPLLISLSYFVLANLSIEVYSPPTLFFFPLMSMVLNKECDTFGINFMDRLHDLIGFDINSKLWWISNRLPETD